MLQLGQALDEQADIKRLHRAQTSNLRRLASKGYLPWHQKKLENLTYVDPDLSSESWAKFVTSHGERGFSSSFGFRKERKLLKKMMREQRRRDAEVCGWIPLVRDGVKNWNLLVERIVSGLTLACGYNVTMPAAISKIKADLREQCQKQMLQKVAKANAGSAASAAYKALKPKIHLKTDYSRILSGESPGERDAANTWSPSPAP
jgi:hypothetical protein